MKNCEDIFKNQIMKTYIKIVLLIAYIFISLGFVLPFLISSDSNELIIVSIVYIIKMPIVVVYLLKSIIVKFKN